MKKFTRILLITICMATLCLCSVGAAFAANSPDSPETSKGMLKLVSSDPKDGDTHMPVQNAGFKLYFNGNVTAESVQSTNKKAFSLSDSEGNELLLNVYFSSSDNNYILVTVNPVDKDGNAVILARKIKIEGEDGQEIEKDINYVLTIAGSLSAADGQTLGEPVKLTVTAVDTSGNTTIYILLMVLMVVGMIAMTFISNKRKAKAKEETEKKEKVVNPYKLAKEKGISVQEAMAQIEKDRQKRAKRLAEAAAAEKKEKEAEKAAPKEISKYRVHEPRPISAGGSSYKTGRKALAEKKAKEEAARRARGTTNPKSGPKNKGKSKK